MCRNFLQVRMDASSNDETIMRLKLCCICYTILLGVACSTFLYSQTTTQSGSAESKPEIEAIQKEITASVAAFNKRDAKAVAAFWTKDGEYADDSGQVFAGRESIEALFAEIFKTHPEFKIQIVTDSVRLVSDSVAIEDGQAITETSPKTPAQLSRYTSVHVKVGGKWLLASLRELPTDSAPISQSLADLEWLVGDWMAEENGSKTESKCRWIVNNRFVERTYTTTLVDGTVTSGVQIIGWNPQSGHIQSWNFSADGGHAIGVWSAIDGGWLAKVTGTTGNNLSTTAVNVLRRLDDHAYVWQSMNRTVGEDRLPDTDEVVIRRKQSTKK